MAKITLKKNKKIIVKNKKNNKKTKINKKTSKKIKKQIKQNSKSKNAKVKKNLKTVPKKVKTTKNTTNKKILKSDLLKSKPKSSSKSIVSNQKIKQTISQGSVEMVKIHELVPDFSLPSTEGSEFKLSQYLGKNIVLYFYPKDSTPGCTTEGLQFSQLMTEFDKLSTVIFGVSRDSLGSHDKFRCNQNFKFHLLSDSEEVACKLFDVIKEKNMYGKMVLGIERSTFLISDKGILIKEWRKVKADGHAAEVLQAIKDIK